MYQPGGDAADGGIEILNLIPVRHRFRCISLHFVASRSSRETGPLAKLTTNGKRHERNLCVATFAQFPRKGCENGNDFPAAPWPHLSASPYFNDGTASMQVYAREREERSGTQADEVRRKRQNSRNGGGRFQLQS